MPIKEFVYEMVQEIAMPPHVCRAHSIVQDKLDDEDNAWTDEQLMALIKLSMHWGQMIQRGGDLHQGWCRMPKGKNEITRQPEEAVS